MSIKLSELAKRIEPKNSVLFFGAGSSIPSGAPSVSKIINRFAKICELDKTSFSLGEVSALYEDKYSRKEMIGTLRKLFKSTSPTGSLLNLPLYNWKNIYTTNYDTLIEQSYEIKKIDLSVISSNFDFKVQDIPETVKLFKLHGSIDKDEVDGIHSKIIITDSDYDATSDYREYLYASLSNDLFNANLIIVGYSLADAHIKEIITRAVDINNKSSNPATITLLLYTEDENRASLYEKRGIKVAFGGLDEFFIELDKNCNPTSLVYSSTGNPLDNFPSLRPVSFDVDHDIENSIKNVSAMFNGWPASYADIAANLTFPRSLNSDLAKSINSEDGFCTILLGGSGTGKTTLAKQILFQQNQSNIYCWEHKSEHNLLSKHWSSVANNLKKNNEIGLLLIDEAHNHIYEINSLVDLLVSNDNLHLKLFLISARNQWYPRVKTPNIFRYSKEYVLRTLDAFEVEELLKLVDTNLELKPLIENEFGGFSRTERKRRLISNCSSDTFVCLKNIFASEKFDDIVLREFATLKEEYRDIYRIVAAMESSGINVHRQLVVRLLGIPAENIAASLTHLVDIITEFTISERDGIYGWRGRHPVITDIIAQYKVPDVDEYFKIFEEVIDSINPSYDIEIRTIRQLCGFEKGIGRLPDKHKRNVLLRKMISKAPGERVPRHRLIRYLIDINQLEKAETEIRLFENDFKADGPVHRFKIMLLLARAERTPGILEEDRKVILANARDYAMRVVEKYKDNKDMLRTYCDVGIEIFKKENDMTVFDDAMLKLKDAEERIGDPDITSIIINCQRKLSSIEYL